MKINAFTIIIIAIVIIMGIILWYKLYKRKPVGNVSNTAKKIIIDHITGVVGYLQKDWVLLDSERDVWNIPITIKGGKTVWITATPKEFTPLNTCKNMLEEEQYYERKRKNARRNAKGLTGNQREQLESEIRELQREDKNRKYLRTFHEREIRDTIKGTPRPEEKDSDINE